MAATLQLKRSAASPPLREGRAPVRERLIAMLFLTALLHAIVILGLTFTSGAHGGADDTPNLEVLLVTDQLPQAQSNDPATYLAQRTQLGAGNSDAPLPAASPSSRGAIALERGTGSDAVASSGTATPDERVLASTAASRDIRYFADAPSKPAAADPPELIADEEGAARSGHGDALELRLRGKSSGQRWIAPDTRVTRLAPYLAAWKRKVERVGTLNFPSAARSAGLSGSPVVEVEIRSDGRLARARVRRSSGYSALDEAALSILKLASPFDPFPAELATDYSRLRFAYQWEFAAGALQTGSVTTSSDTASGP